MLEYIKAQNKTNEVVLNHEFNEDELHRFSKADFRWANNRAKSYQTRKVKNAEENYRKDMISKALNVGSSAEDISKIMGIPLAEVEAVAKGNG